MSNAPSTKGFFRAAFERMMEARQREASRLVATYVTLADRNRRS
ncbi:MAG: hypothetical protein ABTQ31_14030 [Rhizobiaceae bacterium]